MPPRDDNVKTVKAGDLTNPADPGKVEQQPDPVIQSEGGGGRA
jgi:hypothetical protein